MSETPTAEEVAEATNTDISDVKRAYSYVRVRGVNGREEEDIGEFEGDDR